jgi:hypothetical protein
MLTQGFQSGPVPGTFTRLRSCIVPALHKNEKILGREFINFFMKNIPQAYRPSYFWFWPLLILGGSVISAGTIHDLRNQSLLFLVNVAFLVKKQEIPILQ